MEYDGRTAWEDAPPALESNSHIWETSRTAPPTPSVYLSACSSIKHTPDREGGGNLPSETPVRRAPSPVLESSTPTLFQAPPLPPGVSKFIGGPSSSAADVVADLRHSLLQIKQQAHHLAEDIRVAATLEQRPTHDPITASQTSIDLRGDSIRLLEERAKHRSPPVPHRSSGGVHTPPNPTQSSYKTAHVSPRPRPGPSGIDLLRLEYEALERKLGGIHLAIDECDQFAARYNRHATEMERKWRDEEDRWEQEQEALISLLRQRGKPIPKLQSVRDQ